MKVYVEIDSGSPQFIAAALTACRVCAGDPTTSDQYTEIEHMLDILCSNLEGDLDEWGRGPGFDDSVKASLTSLHRLIGAFETFLEVLT